MKYGEILPGDLIHDNNRGWLVIAVEIEGVHVTGTYHILWSVDSYLGIIKNPSTVRTDDEIGDSYKVIRYK